MLIVARLVAASALARRESRGAHHRLDHPRPDPTAAARSFVDPVPVPAAAVAVPAGRTAA
jgi:L-aspartate oxidase